jgi:hypothetical protein
MFTRLIWAWCMTTIAATLCFLTGWASAGESWVAPPPATALAHGAAAPYRDAASLKGAQIGGFLSHDAYRSQPKPGVLIGMLEPEVAGGTGTNRPGIAPAPSTDQVREPSISSCTYEFRNDYMFTSRDSVTAQDRKTPRFSLLSCPQRSSFSDADKVNGKNAIFGSTELTIADLRMPANGVSPHFRPLLEIHLGAYELPISLYTPNQTDWPRY